MADLFAKLDPRFANALRGLLSEAQGRITLTDGYRTRAQQEDVYRRKPNLAAPPGHSLHEYGLAADLGGDTGLAHRLGPKYGIHFPVKGEDWHAQLIGGPDPRRGRAATAGTGGGIMAAATTTRRPTMVAQNPEIPVPTTAPATFNDVLAYLNRNRPLITNPNDEPTVDNINPMDAIRPGWG